MTRRAVIAPDERSWLLWGHDLRAAGFVAAPSPAQADVLLAPERVPASLSAALREVWDAMPAARHLVTPADPLGSGEHTRSVLLDGGDSGDADEHDMHDMHGGHDHDAMMAVTGDPSADGLVMEDLEFTLGPFSAMLPGGVVARLTVDGDVVCRADLSAALDADDATAPDPTAAAAWKAARGSAADGEQREHMVAVELERAVSHASWLASLGALLGWIELADAGRGAALAALAVKAPTGDGLDAAESAARTVAQLVAGSRRLRFRLGGLAPLTVGDVGRHGLAGPNARAAGVAVDERARDPFYVALGFTPVVDDGGDAAARARVRAAELVASLALVRRGGGEGVRADGITAPDAVEGPRGPVTAHGSDGVFDAAAECVAGLEWSAAMAAIASFDLSGWRVAQ